MGWARGFESGSRAMGDILDTYFKSKERGELADIAKAKPEEMQGFTTDDTAQLEAAAKSGQYDIGTKTKDDGTFEAYTITPKSDPTQTGVIAQQGVTDFMGNRTAGSMSPDQANTARERAMAGVIMKRDPIQGMRMMRDITQAGRDDERYGFEKTRNEREMRLASEQDADKLFAKNMDSEVGDWFKSRLTGPDGQPRSATVDDHLAASQYRAAKLVQAGKPDAAGQIMKDYNAQALVKIQLEGAQRNEALGKTAAALASGDTNAVRDFYNQYVPDGARVTDVAKGPKGEIVIQRERLDGTPMPPTTMKDTGQMLAALSTFKDPMALYNWSQNEFKNNLAIKADKRADNADGRAGAQFTEGRADKTEAKAEKKAKADAAVALFQDRNPGASAAEIEAVRRGIIDATPKNKEFTSDYKPDGMGQAGTAIQKDKAGNLVVTKIDAKGNLGKSVVIAPPGQKPGGAAPKDQADAHAQAAAAVAKGADKAAINERLKKLGYQPIP